MRSGRRSPCRTFATWIEFVTTVRSGTSSEVVREAPGRRAGREPDRLTRLDERAAARAIASFSSSWRCDFASNPGSSALSGPGAVAPPCTLSTRPAAASTSRSRRTVMSETSSSSVNSLTRTAAAAANFLENQHLTLFGEHDDIAQYSTRSQQEQPVEVERIADRLLTGSRSTCECNPILIPERSSAVLCGFDSLERDRGGSHVRRKASVVRLRRTARPRR